MDKKVLKDKLKAGILGHLTGDALGVPVEFKSRDYLKNNPVREMIGYGTYNQPPGTWSDDSSLTLCLLESLTKGYDLDDQAEKFVDWLYEAYWTARGETFDVGNTSRNSIKNLKKGINPLKAGAGGEYDNGNGSLMRILPLAFYLLKKNPSQRLKITAEVSSLTHSHIRSILGCFIYLDFAIRIIEGTELKTAYKQSQKEIRNFFAQAKYTKYQKELSCYQRLIKDDIAQFKEAQINSSGYIVDTLEAAFWVLLTTNSYQAAVLKAVNLGQDTDTVAAIAGGLAGIYYGCEQIPAAWRAQLARKGEIITLINKFSSKYFE